VIYEFQPLEDARWTKFLETQPRASVFHSLGWLQALHRTYGYEPVVYTSVPPDRALENGIVACLVNSWLTGPRLVSVPFADHCEPLVNDLSDLATFSSFVAEKLQGQDLRYVELRPLRSLRTQSALCLSTRTYCFHHLDLSPDCDTLFRNFHKDSTQRKIHRAEREALSYEEGQSEAFLETFYGLFVPTRQRHHLPPPPKSWFQNLIHCFPGTLKIRVIRNNQHPIASIITIRYKDTLVYKYGGSDPRFHNLGGMHLLFWKSIQEAKREGLHTLDLGRSDLEDHGLITFKNRWGAKRSDLTYLRYVSSPKSKGRFRSDPGDWKSRVGRNVIARLPENVLAGVGTLLYKHVG
jgi:hypothetical protein